MGEKPGSVGKRPARLEKKVVGYFEPTVAFMAV